MLGMQLAGTGVELSIAFPGMTTTAMTASWGPEGRAAAAMLRVWGSHAHVTAPQVRFKGLNPWPQAFDGRRLCAVFLCNGVMEATQG